MFGIGTWILPIIGLFYVGVAALIVLGIWLAILGIRALRLYLRLHTPPREP